MLATVAADIVRRRGSEADCEARENAAIPQAVARVLDGLVVLGDLVAVAVLVQTPFLVQRPFLACGAEPKKHAGASRQARQRRAGTSVLAACCR